MKHIKLFENFLNEAYPAKTLNTEFLEQLKNKKELWGESGNKGLLYNGQNVFDIYVSDDASQKFHAAIMEDDDLEKKEDFAEDSYQEVYLGYMPKFDCFLAGFDVWGIEGVKSIAIEFNIRDGEVQDAKIHDANQELFYGRPSIYSYLAGWRSREGEEKTIIDIRLD